jgi:hypothetical protein
LSCGVVVVVTTGDVVDVVNVVVVESELPLLENAKLKPKAMRATTTSTAVSLAKPAGRHRQVFRGAAWRGFDMGQSYFGTWKCHRS